MYQNQNPYQQNQFAQNPYGQPDSALNPYQQNIDIVKNYFKKPAMLALAIISALTVLLKYAFSFYSVSSITDFLRTVAQYTNDSEMSFALTYAMSSSTFSMISSAAFSLLPVISFFLIYFKSKNSSPSSNPSVGFTILWVLAIIGLVPLILGALAVLFAVFVLMFAASFAGEDAAFAVPFILIIAFILLAALGFGLFFQISELRFFGSVRNSMKELQLKSKGAAPYGVICIISGICTVLNLSNIFFMPAMLATIADNVSFNATEASIFALITETISSFAYFSVLPVILAAVQAILMGVIALGYNKYIKNLTLSYPTNGGINQQPMNGGFRQTAEQQDQFNQDDRFVQ